MTDLYNFIATHKAALSLACAWAVRDWTTVGGWVGLKNYFLTGKSTKPQQQKENTP